jgi:hypothetical protein
MDIEGAVVFENETDYDRYLKYGHQSKKEAD